MFYSLSFLALRYLKNSESESISITSDLLRAALLHELSLHSPYQLINTTGNEESFRGVVPDESQVAILSGKVKYEEIIFESQEELSYFTNVKNKGDINTKSDLALVSGDNAKLAISSDGKLSIKITESTLQNLIENECLRKKFREK